jgi:hypothetical protein
VRLCGGGQDIDSTSTTGGAISIGCIAESEAHKDVADALLPGCRSNAVDSGYMPHKRAKGESASQSA